MARPNDPIGEFLNLVEADADPVVVGALGYRAGSFRMRDGAGVFDPRTGGGGLSEAQHEALDRLTHDINESSFDELTYSGRRLTNLTTWASPSKILKVREEQYTYNGHRVTQIVTVQYNGLGVEVERNTEILTYAGHRVATNTRTHA